MLSVLFVFFTFYDDKQYTDLLGSIVRVRHCILVPDFYLVLHAKKAL